VADLDLDLDLEPDLDCNRTKRKENITFEKRFIKKRKNLNLIVPSVVVVLLKCFVYPIKCLLS
jgi:hypothetical protein